MRKSKSVSN